MNTHCPFSPERYPHTRALISHYAHQTGEKEIDRLVAEGIRTKAEAEFFARFIWNMADHMRADTEARREILGGTDNTDMLPDVAYEVEVWIATCGFKDVWEKVSRNI